MSADSIGNEDDANAECGLFSARIASRRLRMAHTKPVAPCVSPHPLSFGERTAIDPVKVDKRDQFFAISPRTAYRSARSCMRSDVVGNRHPLGLPFRRSAKPEARRSVCTGTFFGGRSYSREPIALEVCLRSNNGDGLPNRSPGFLGSPRRASRGSDRG